MPLLRYFTYVGGALIALIYIGSYLIPEPAMVPQHDAARPAIRIASDRIIPPRVDFDTSTQSAALAPSQSAPAPVREAYAQLLSSPAAAASTTAGPVKPEPKSATRGESRKTKIAKRSDRQLLAAYPQAAYPHVAGYPQGFQPFRWTW